MPQTILFAATSKFAFLNIIAGFVQLNSRVSGVKFFEANFIMDFPVSVLPVKKIWSKFWSINFKTSSTYILVGFTFSIYIGIAIWSRAASTKDFYVAGGGVNPIANGMATAADWMSAASFISMAGIISFGGYDGSVFLMGWTGGFVLLALLIAPYLRKFGKFTVPDFIGDRYYSNSARTVAVFCALIVSFTYIAGQMLGVGLVFSRYLEVDIVNGILIGKENDFFPQHLNLHFQYYIAEKYVWIFAIIGKSDRCRWHHFLEMWED